MEILQDVLLVQVGNYLLETEDELSLASFHLVFVPDLVEGQGGGGLFPLWLRQFQELIEDEAGGLLPVPPIGNESPPEPANLLYE